MKDNFIHPSAIVDAEAKLGEGNYIGPFCVITRNVEIGNNNELKSHVVIDGETKIGDNNQFFSFASIGAAPQDKKYQGEASQLIIGSRNVFREYTTAHPGTEAGGMLTKIGDDCLLMISAHVAHDCQIGNFVTMSNSVALGGHVIVGNYVTIGGLSAVLQRTRIGDHAMVGGMSGVAEDVIPYGVVMGERAHLAGLNVVGLKRRKFTREIMHDIRRAYEIVFHEENLTFQERLRMAKEEFFDSQDVMLMLNFLLEDNTRAVCKPKVIIKNQ